MQHQATPHSQEQLPVDPLLTDFDLERLTGRARSSWQKARLTGDGPKFLRLGRLVRYRASDVAAWLAARPALRSTSDTAAGAR
jgi:predicted DNA-binding transcriptional regulator AlpA